MGGTPFTLEQLRCFVAVAEELHFGRAAHRLAMTQPPLTRQIQKLERTLGVALLVRDRRGVEVTAAGRAFLPDCHAVLALMDRAAERTRAVGHGTGGTVRVGATGVASYTVLPQLLRRVDREAVDLDVEVHEGISADQVEHVRKGEIDVGFVRPMPVDKDIDLVPVFEEPLVAAVPAGHPLDRPGAVTPADLAKHRLIGYSRLQSPYLADLFVPLFLGTDARASQQVNQVLTGMALVSVGYGVTFVPAGACVMGMPGVVFREIEADHDVPRARMCAALSAGRASPAARRLVDWARDEGPPTGLEIGV